MYYVYILRGSNNKLYIGQTTNIQSRVSRHNNYRGSQFTKQGSNFILVYSEQFLQLLDAMRREKQLKGWTRRKKEALINQELDKLKKL